jgi:hypothetical protein
LLKEQFVRALLAEVAVAAVTALDQAVGVEQDRPWIGQFQARFGPSRAGEHPDRRPAVAPAGQANIARTGGQQVLDDQRIIVVILDQQHPKAACRCARGPHRANLWPGLTRSWPFGGRSAAL